MKKTIYIGLSILLAAVIIAELALLGAESEVFALSNDKKPVYKVETADKKVAVSFDAAWGADNTERLLDILDSYNVGATFFLVGFWIEKYPDMVKEIDLRGYEIGNHSANHPQMSKLSRAQMQAEIKSVNEKLYSITGKTPTVFRPPFGDYNSTLIEVLEEMNMHGVQWSIDSLDWKGIGKTEITERVLKRVEAGDIILFHNNADYTPDALPGIIEELLNRGFEICSVGELIYTEDYYVDTQGIQRKCAS